jgi:hypothetical protein
LMSRIVRSSSCDIIAENDLTSENMIALSWRSVEVMGGAPIILALLQWLELETVDRQPA